MDGAASRGGKLPSQETYKRTLSGHPAEATCIIQASTREVEPVGDRYEECAGRNCVIGW